jgi:16S rRNA (cytosine1402-N4)-methyltransferase
MGIRIHGSGDGADMAEHSFPHTPVMLDRIVELFTPTLEGPGRVVVDATLGMGGHSEGLLERFPELTLIGLDRDTDALGIAGERLARFGDRVRLVHTVYDEIESAIRGHGFDRVDGVLFDLGVSSLQLDRAERGFAYSQDAPLDMRMDQTAPFTAAEVIATYDERDLVRIFRNYGEEKLAQRYARAIVARRVERPFERSGDLVDVLQQATPVAVQRQGHPAKRVFQALRIEVNQELSVLERAIPAAMDSLAVGGRLVVEAYQSLEDRIVKRAIAERTKSSAPAGLPVELPEHAPTFTNVVKGAEQADEAERAANPRATPVRLRAAERIRK